MDTITFGLFHTQESVENAINELSRHGFLLQDISIFMEDKGIAQEVSKNTGAYVLKGLIGLGLAEEHAKIYEGDIKTGAILLGVPIPTTNMSEATVKQILQRNKASQIRSINRNVKN